MLDVTTNFKGDCFTCFRKFQVYWESDERLDCFPFDLIDIFAHLYDKETAVIQDAYVKEIIQEYPYLIFTNHKLLHDPAIIEYACTVDRDILKALLFYGDEETEQLLDESGYLLHLIKNYHCHLDKTMFEEKVLNQFLRTSEIFKLQYYQDNVEELLLTTEGRKLFRECYALDCDLHYELMMLTPTETLKEVLKTRFNILKEHDFISIAYIVDDDEYEFMTYSSLIDLENDSYMNQEDWLKPYIVQMVDFSISHRDLKTKLLIDSIDFYISDVTSPSAQFYIDCAKEEVPALLYSSKFEYDICFWLEAIRANSEMIRYVPETLLQNPKFVLTGRLFVDDILYYCNEILLDTPTFILTYLTFFSSRVCFRVGRNLMLTDNEEFLQEVYQLDPSALHYFFHGDIMNRVEEES